MGTARDGSSTDPAARTCRPSRADARWCSTCCRRARSNSPRLSHRAGRGTSPTRRRPRTRAEVGGTMPSLSSADHRVTPPHVEMPREYNAAHDLIERNLAAGRAGKTAYIDDRGSYTYGELAERINRCANALTALGVAREERVLLCLLDTIDFPAAFLGAIKAGIVPVAGNTLLTTRDYEYMLRDSRAGTLVVSAALYPAFAPLIGKLPDLRHVIVSDATDEHVAAGHHSLERLMESAGTRFAAAETTCDDMCFWLYSSGSTGAPKGTVHIHSSLIETAELY